jgi:hypothetical protein
LVSQFVDEQCLKKIPSQKKKTTTNDGQTSEKIPKNSPAAASQFDRLTVSLLGKASYICFGGPPFFLTPNYF